MSSRIECHFLEQEPWAMMFKDYAGSVARGVQMGQQYQELHHASVERDHRGRGC